MVAALSGLWVGAAVARTAPAGDSAPFTAIAADGERLENPRSANASRRRPDPVSGMQFTRLRLDTTTAVPRACLQFSKPLNPKIAYTDYLQITPAAPVTTEVSDNQLCLSGLGFQPDREIVIRQGLPSQDGKDKTPRDETVNVAFGDRPTYVGFAGRGVILPRAEADGIGIETVNVSKLEVEVLRVGDRILGRKDITPGSIVAEGDWNYYDFEEDGSDVGVSIYKDKINVKGDRNAPVTTVFPLGSVLRAGDAGAYVVKVRDASPGAGVNGKDTANPAAATRWIVYTDMALQTFAGSSGLDVVVRSIESARPLQGVRVALLGANNDLLGEGRSNGEGLIRFDDALMKGEGPDRARYVMAYGRNSDFAALDLERPALDLTDRGIDGRETPVASDAFMYTERGVYRPGENVKLTGLLRSRTGNAINGRAAMLTLTRPNGTEAQKMRIDPSVEAGGFVVDYPLTSTAPRGQWTASVTVDGDTVAAGSVSFAVEDFVPQRLKISTTADAKPLTVGETRPVLVDAQFLYGAPGSGLGVQADGRVVLDPKPFEAFAEYSFGREEDVFEEKLLGNLGAATTDASGKATIPLGLSDVPATFQPLMARVNVTVTEPGGRAVTDSLKLPVRTQPLYLGVRPKFTNRQVDKNGTAEFDVIALDGLGAVANRAGLSWTLVEEEWTYDWYMQDGEWRWRSNYRDRPVFSGTLETKGGTPAVIRRAIEGEGQFRLVVRDDLTGVETSVRFTAGWSWGSGQDDVETPDTVQISTPKDPVRRGQSARLSIRPPYAGEAQIVVATDRVIETRTVSLRAGDNVVELRPTDDWGAGAYVMVTVMTPRSPDARPVPRRAVGVNYVGVDMKSRTLEVAVDLPPKVSPRQRLTVPIKVRGAPRGDIVRVTLAAVDEGILQITRFNSPDPAKWYYGRRALSVALRDDYGRLLNPNLDAPSDIRGGGDGEIGGEGLTVVPTSTVALFSGLVKLDRNGEAKIPVDVPDFNGELRLMTVAWSEQAVGSLSKPLVVRDPVVADLTLPRFLAPGDAANATLLLDNVEGRPGDYVVTVGGKGITAAQATSRTFTLPVGQKTLAVFPVTAPAAGVGEVTMTVTGPQGFSVARNYPIQSRAPWLPVTNVAYEQQAPGAAFNLTSGVLSQYTPGTGAVAVSYSAIRGLDPGPLFDALERYPYYCSEQLASVSMPLLYSGELAAAGGKSDDPKLRRRVQDAINRLLDRQSENGSFGLWAEGDAQATPWLGAYIVDFLRRAKEAGYAVPDGPMEAAYKGLRPIVRTDDWSDSGYNFIVQNWTGNQDTQERLQSRSAAYALYVMAKGGQADVGQLRYWADAKLDAEPSPLARAQIGAALAHLGDRARSREAFAKAESALGYRNNGDWYQTPVRDLAGVLALAAEAGETELVGRLATRLERETPNVNNLMTQEQSQLVLAAHALIKRAGPISIGGGSPGTVGRFVADVSRLGAGLSFANRGTGPVWRSVTTSGVPLADPGATSRGISINKSFRTLEGGSVDPGNLRQGQKVIVVLTGRADGARVNPAVIVDLLPAGLEIEGALRPEDGASQGSGLPPGAFGWIGALTDTRVAEGRDDRFVAAVDVSNQTFTIAYMARAVTPGSYVLPGAQIEDMYRPGVFGRSSTSRLVVGPAQ
jgi:alpha-2-macroglobulin